MVNMLLFFMAGLTEGLSLAYGPARSLSAKRFFLHRPHRAIAAGLILAGAFAAASSARSQSGLASNVRTHPVRVAVNAICLLIDGLNAGYLGCYGNASIGTPEFDRLASESFVLDQAILDSPTCRALSGVLVGDSCALEPAALGRELTPRATGSRRALPPR